MNKIRKNWCMHTALVAHAAANCQKTAPVVTQENNPKTRRAYALTASSVFILKYSSASFGLFASCALTSSVLCVARIAVTVYCLCQYWNVHLRKSVNKIRIRRDINPIKMFSIHSKTIWNVYLLLPAPTHTHVSCAMLNTGNEEQFHCACVCDPIGNPSSHLIPSLCVWRSFIRQKGRRFCLASILQQNACDKSRQLSSVAMSILLVQFPCGVFAGLVNTASMGRRRWVTSI